MKKIILLVLVLISLVFLATYFSKLELKKKLLASQNLNQIILDENDFYTIKANIPNEPKDKDSVMKNFLVSITDYKKDEWKIGGEIYNQEMQIQKDWPDRPKTKYEFLIDYTKYESEKFQTVSYKFTTYEFTGGANGNTTVTTFTFDNNGQVNIDQVLNFNNFGDIALTKILYLEAQKSPFLFPEKDMLRDGLGLSYLKPDGKTLDHEKCRCDGFFFGSNFQNFIISDDGIIFTFSKYDIAPGSSGTPEIKLTWANMNKYLLGAFK